MTEQDLQNVNKWNEITDKDGFYITVSLPGVLSQTTGYYDQFFIARQPIEVLRVSEVHTTAETAEGSAYLDIEKLTGTTAPGSGTSILASEQYFDLKSTANTVSNRENFTGLSSARQLKENERLALKDLGTATLSSLTGVQVTLYCKYLNKGGYR